MKYRDPLFHFPEKCKQWLVENEWEEGAKTFLSNAGEPMAKGEKMSRERALILGILWYDLHGKNEHDFKTIPSVIELTLNEFIKKRKDEDEDDFQHRLRDLWCDMCQHAGEYKYAGIEPQHDFYKALWGAWRTLMDEDFIFELIDIPVEKAIKEGFRQIYPEPDREVSYGVKLKGLDSTIVFIPREATSWPEHADMYVRLVHINQPDI